MPHVCTWFLLSALVPGAFGAALREPVHPRRNVEDFSPVEARFVRFTIRSTNRGEPCLDELEIYGPDDSRNLALASAGARATSSGSLPEYAIHQLEWVNDGRYGNGRSWIADRVSGAWVQIELPQPTRINKVVWGRDREGNFIDRLVTGYTLEVALDTNAWRTVASSDDREPLGFGAELAGGPSLRRSFVNRFAPVGTRISDDEPSTAEYSIDVWQTSDGLPANTVTSIAQTPDGYLWIGTLNGLARFDGLQFKIFGEGSALPGNRVLSLLAARDGTLWIGTDGGGVASLRHGVLNAFPRRDGHDTVNDIAEDSIGRVWMATAAGLSCWFEGRFITNATTRAAWIASAAAEVDPSGTLWAVIGSELRMQGGTNVLARPTAPEPSSFSSVLALHAGRSGQVWFGGVNGYIGSVSNGAVHVFHEQPGHLLEAIWTLCESRRGDVWAGTASGGLRRLRNGRFTSITTQDGLSDNAVRCVFEDREGNLWVGTVGGGLNRLKEKKLRAYTTRDGLTHNVVMSLAEADDGTLWAGSNCGGLTARRNGVFSAVSANYLLDNECIWSVLPARDGALWIGTWGGGLFRLSDPEGERPKGTLSGEHVRSLVENFPITRPGDDEPVLALCESASGGVWVGTMQAGLRLFRDGQWREHGITNLPSNAITCLDKEPDGTLWVGTSGGGLSRLARGRLITCTRRDGLPSDFIRTLFRDSKGDLWVGTGGGLARLHSAAAGADSSPRFDSFTRADGLPDDVISQILEDDQGNLWLGCNQGIVRVPRQQFAELASGGSQRLNAIHYGRAEGMESIECTGGFDPAGVKTRDGNLWFSTVKGVVMVDPKTITANEIAPPVVLENVVITTGRPGSQQTRTLAITNGDPAFPSALGARLQRLEFHFNGLSLVAPERNRFKYRLEGFDANWVEGAQRVATYTHLPPGHYTFRVQASNNDGVWNEVGAFWGFTVAPGFWQTWWFRALIAALILGGGGTLVRYLSVRRLRRKLRLLEEKHLLEQERTRIAQDIHDELGASLTRIALLSELGQKHRDQPSEITADLAKISATAREAVRAMDAIVWAVNPHNDSLDHFANYLSHFAEDFFRLSTIHCRLDIPEDLPEQPLTTDARHQLFLAVKEAFNNVVRHSRATEVWLRVRCDDGELRVIIEDNGCGLPMGEPGPGQDGITNIRQRLQRLGGSLEVSSQRGEGTSLHMRLPMRSSDCRARGSALEQQSSIQSNGRP